MPKNPVYNAPAKLNIFLKVVGFQQGYHQLSSRFVRLDGLSDQMWFEPGDGQGFDIVGDFDCDVKSNTIYKAYRALVDHHPTRKVIDFCRMNRVMVYKRIPAKAGLGGGSSNAATFLQMLNELLDLKISAKEMNAIGADVGADVPFFLSGAQSANVSGFGQHVVPFEEELPEFELMTPSIGCDTRKVFQVFRTHFSAGMRSNGSQAAAMVKMTTKELLERYDAPMLNDLLPAALKAYPELYEHNRHGWFFSGSGSTFFRIRD